MAFRSHEINLMLRVQDRASGRLRRVANDLGGVNRAAQLQNKAAQLQKSQAANLNNQVKLRSSLMSKLNSQSVESIAHERKLFDLTTKRMQLINSKHDNPIIYKRQLLAIENQILDLEQKRSREIDDINRGLSRSVALEKAQRAEAQKLLAQQVAANKIEARNRQGRNLMHVGSAAGFVGGAGIAISAGLSGGAANFNRQATRAATQLRGPGESLGIAVLRGQQLEKTILGLSRVFPATMTEMADSAYEIASGMNLGTDSATRLKNTTQLLAVANKAAVAGGIDLESATDSMIVTLNNFDPELQHVNQTMNTLFATVKYGKGTFDQFSPVFGKMSAGAKTANQSLTEAGGAVAFLSTRMASQAQAVVGYTRLLQVMQRKEFVDGFKAMFNVSALLPGTDKLRPLSQIIAMMVKARPGMVSGGQDLANIIQEITARGDIAAGAKKSKGMQSTIQARTALQQLVMGWKDYAEILGQVSANTDEFSLAYKQMNQSPGVRWQVAINQFKAFAIVIGQNVLPQMLRLMTFVQGLAHRYEALSPGIKKAIGFLMVFGSLTLFVGGTVSILVGAILTLMSRLALLGVSLSSVHKKLVAASAILRGLSVLAKTGIVIGVVYLLTVKWSKESRGDFFGTLDKKLNEWGHSGSGAMGLNPFKPIAIAVSSADAFLRGRDLKDPKNEAKFKAAEAVKDESEFGLSAITNAHKTSTANILQDWKNLTANLTGLQYMSGLTAQTMEGVNAIQMQLAKAQSTGNTSATVAAAKKYITFLDKEEAKLEKLVKLTPYQQKQLKQYYEQEAQMRAIVTSATNKETAAQTKANKAKEVAATRLETAKQKVEQLKLTFEGLREQELNKLQSAFGNLFSGPILSGPLGGIFSNINSTLAGFGIKPIAVPIDLMLQDQASQQSSFDALTKGLDRITPKIPKKFRNAFTEQVMSMGTGAVPFLESLMGAPNSKRNKFIQNFIKSQESLDKATKSPWQMQLTAADIQYKSALLQWKAAGGKLSKAEQGIVNAGKTKTTAAKPVPTSTTRTTQGVTHNTGDNITVHADGASTGAVTAAINKGKHAKKYARRY